MLTTKKESPAIQVTGKTAEGLISKLLSSLPAERHFINMQTMMIGFLRDPETEHISDSDKDSINVTFMIFESMLKDLMMEG